MRRVLNYRPGRYQFLLVFYIFIFLYFYIFIFLYFYRFIFLVFIMKATSGTVQGSILEPQLWNISFDEILKIGRFSDTYLVGYADVIAAVIAGCDIEETQHKLTQVMLRTKGWLDDLCQKLATEKTELVIITKRYIPLTVEIQVLTENPHIAVN